MAIACVDEVWLREPRLLVPGRQPLGPVKVDLGHWFGKHCKFCLTASVPNVNLVGCGKPTSTTGSSSLTTDVGRKYIYYANGVGETYAINAAGATVQTTIAVMNFLGAEYSDEDAFSANGSNLITYRAHNQGFDAIYSGSLRVFEKEGYKLPHQTICISSGLNTIDIHTLTPYSIYQSSFTGSYTDTGYPTGASSITINGGANSSLYLALLAIATIKISAAQVQALCRDPYQFLTVA